MNIKSNFSSNSLFNFEGITFGTVVFSIILGILLSSLIIATDLNVFLKILMVIGTMIASAVALDGIIEKTSRIIEIKKYIITIFITIIVCEIGLYTHYDRFSEKITVISAVEVDCPCGPTMTIIEYYSGLDNSKIADYRVDTTRKDRIAFLKSVTGAKVSIEYTPFVRYSEMVEYIRDKPLQDLEENK